MVSHELSFFGFDRRYGGTFLLAVPDSSGQVSLLAYMPPIPGQKDAITMGGIQIIVAVAAEGGSIVLYGQKDSRGNWMFCRGVADQTPTFLTESDGRGESISHNSAQVKTWEEAIALMDKYPWAMLSGVEVHPEFHHCAWEAVEKRLEGKSGARMERAKARWANVCGVNLDI